MHKVQADFIIAAFNLQNCQHVSRSEILHASAHARTHTPDKFAMVAQIHIKSSKPGTVAKMLFIETGHKYLK